MSVHSIHPLVAYLSHLTSTLTLPRPLHRSRFPKQSGFGSDVGCYQLQLEVPINFFGWHREAWGGIGKCGVQASDYLEQELEPAVAPAFQGLFGYEGYREKQEEGEEWGL
jgi:hypothetical protein